MPRTPAVPDSTLRELVASYRARGRTAHELFTALRDEGWAIGRGRLYRLWRESDGGGNVGKGRERNGVRHVREGRRAR